MDFTQLQTAVYEQRRQVESLRQQALFPTVPVQADQLMEELLEAEQQLAELERQAAAAQPPPNEAVKRQEVFESRMGSETTGLDVHVKLRQEHVPTGIVQLFAHDEHPLVTCELSFTGREFMQVQVSAWVEGYSAEAVESRELTNRNRTTKIDLLPTFFPDALSVLNEVTRATLHVKVVATLYVSEKVLKGQIQDHRTLPVWLLPRSSAYLTMRDPANDQLIDLRPYLAAWVTPNAPEVMELLREAAELHPDRHIVGYQKGAASVQAQVKCVYEAIKARELTYVNSLVSFGAGAGERMQRVRLPRESLQYRSANCMDGTILMASVLEFASLNPGIALVPGHAFLAWEKRRGSGDTVDWEYLAKGWDYLETTMIAEKDFETAVQRGRQLAEYYQRQAQIMENSKYFQLVSLKKARVEAGILPME